MGLLLSFEELQIAAQLLADTVRDWGGELNVKKTKWMCIRSALAGLGRVVHVLHVNNEEMEQVNQFSYLGSVVASDADLGQHRDVAARVCDASKAFGQLRGLWGDCRVLLSTKRTIFLACVCTALFWGAETWTQRAPELQMMRRAWYSRGSNVWSSTSHIQSCGSVSASRMWRPVLRGHLLGGSGTWQE